MIVWENIAMAAEEDIDVMSGGNTPTVDFSIVQTAPVAGWGGNNLIQDPVFVSVSERNLRLADGSPAIDSGDNSVLPADLTDVDKDLDFAEEVPWSFAKNNRRKTDDPDVPGGSQANPIVDRGAHERLGELPIQ